jgi:hypothetical protein
METQILELLQSKLEDRRLELVDFLGRGNAATYDAYKEVCGQIRGLQAAQLEIADLVRRVKEINDD